MMEVKSLDKAMLKIFQDEISLHEGIEDLLLYARVDLVVDQVEYSFNKIEKTTCMTYSQLLVYILEGIVDRATKELFSNTFAYSKMLSAFKANRTICSQAFLYQQGEVSTWAMLRVRLVQDPTTNVVYAFLYLQDINKRKKLEARIHRQITMNLDGLYQMPIIKQLCESKHEESAALLYMPFVSLPEEIRLMGTHQLTMMLHDGLVGMNENYELFIFLESCNEEMIHTKLTSFLKDLKKYHSYEDIRVGGILYSEDCIFEQLQEDSVEVFKEAMQRDKLIFIKHMRQDQDTCDVIEELMLFDADMLKKELQSIDYTTITSASVIAGEYRQDKEEVIKILRECDPAGWIYVLDGNIFIMVMTNISETMFIENERNLKQNFSDEVKLYCSYAKEDPNIELMVDRLMTILQMTYTYESAGDKEKYQKLLNEMKKKQYLVYLQPKAMVADGSICGCEALIRYRTKHGDLLTPDAFIPKMEEDGMIQYLDLFVFDQVCKVLQDWKDKGYELFPVSLNFSRITLLSNDLLLKMNTIQKDYSFSRDLIEIEITERVGEIEQYVMKKITNDISSCGYRLSLDDFGAEYSNVAILSNVAFDTLKIDKEIIHNIHNNHKMQTIITNLSDLCRKLQIQTVAEGVDSIEKLEALREIGVDVMQGYLLNKPIPILEYEKTYLGVEKINCEINQGIDFLVKG